MNKTPVQVCAENLSRAIVEGLKDHSGRVRVEDVVTVAAAVNAELCIEASRHIHPRNHQLRPGSVVLAPRLNELFCGDVLEVEKMPSETLIGSLRDEITKYGYAISDFPSISTDVFQYFAANVGKSSRFGEVPLSVPDLNRPSIPPLPAGCLARPLVDQAFQPLTSTQERLQAGMLTLAEALKIARRVMDEKIALLLALQILNGVSKMAPITDELFESIKGRCRRQGLGSNLTLLRGEPGS